MLTRENEELRVKVTTLEGTITGLHAVSSPQSWGPYRQPVSVVKHGTVPFKTPCFDGRVKSM